QRPERQPVPGGAGRHRRRGAARVAVYLVDHTAGGERDRGRTGPQPSGAGVLRVPAAHRVQDRRHAAPGWAGWAAESRDPAGESDPGTRADSFWSRHPYLSELAERSTG